jgi:hypothetical protein
VICEVQLSLDSRCGLNRRLWLLRHYLGAPLGVARKYAMEPNKVQLGLGIIASVFAPQLLLMHRNA